jgi:hypothetical protein
MTRRDTSVKELDVDERLTAAYASQSKNDRLPPAVLVLTQVSLPLLPDAGVIDENVKADKTVYVFHDSCP